MYIIASPPGIKGTEGIVQNGLLEEYRFEESVGEILIGYKNGYHGTSGTGNNKPTPTSNGWLFFVDDYVDLPEPIKDALSVGKSFTVIFAGMLKANTVLSSVKAVNDRLNINITTTYPKIIRGNLFNVVNYSKAGQEFNSNFFNIFTYTSEGDKAKFFINKDNFRNGITASSAGTTLGCRIGLRPVGSIGLEGTLCNMMIYTRVLTDPEILRNYRVLKNILKLRGVIIGD